MKIFYFLLFFYLLFAYYECNSIRNKASLISLQSFENLTFDHKVNKNSNRTKNLEEISNEIEFNGLINGHYNIINALIILTIDKNDYIVSASEDALIKIWNPITGKCIKTLAAHTLGVKALTLLSNYNYIVSASKDRSIKIWDPLLLSGDPGECRYKNLLGHQDNVNVLAILSYNRKYTSED